jgi:hypothetical protein
MGWLLRNKRYYYYHTIYINGKYVNLYCGGGELGRRFEAMFRQMREARRGASNKSSDRPDGPTEATDASPTD